jgi:putative endonuclease
VARRVNVPARPKNESVSDARRALGARGEALAADRYRAAGYEILDQNWRCRQGELDLVVHRDRVLVFCEVKTRSSDRFGAPIEAITRAKRQRIRVLAGRWLDVHKPVVREVRFDVASVLVGADGEAVVDVMEGAF